MALVGVHTADLAWLHDKTRESVHMIGDVPQSPTLQLDGLGVIVADVHVFIWLLAAGAIIPLILTMLDQDPAQSSTIVLTTITDVTGFFSFLGIATLFSRLL